MKIAFRMPWPPSTNHMYMRAGRQVILTEAAREYRTRAIYATRAIINRLGGALFPIRQRVHVLIETQPIDHRRYDSDNLRKCALDALTHAGLWEDDHLIWHDELKKRDPKPGDRWIDVTVSTL